MENEIEILKKYSQKVEAVSDNVRKEIDKEAQRLADSLIGLLLLYKKSRIKDLPKREQEKIAKWIADFNDKTLALIKTGEKRAVSIAKDANQALSRQIDIDESNYEDNGLKGRIAENSNFLANEIVLVAGLAMLMKWDKSKAVRTFVNNIAKVYTIKDINKVEGFKIPKRGKGVSVSAILQIRKNVRYDIFSTYHTFNADNWERDFKGKKFHYRTAINSNNPCSECVDGSFIKYSYNPLPRHCRCKCVCYIEEE